MKKLHLSLIFLLLNFSVFSQTKIGDVIYPVDSSTPITGIDIIEVVKGNVVVYTEDGEEKTILAIAVKQDSKYINLKSKIEKEFAANSENPNTDFYGAYSLEHYQSIQAKALKSKNGGMGTTIVGIGAMVIGSFIVLNAYDAETKSISDPSSYRTGAILEIGGLLGTVIGIPVWVSGVKKFNKAQKGVDYYNSLNNNVSLNLGVTQNGAGLLIRF